MNHPILVHPDGMEFLREDRRLVLQSGYIMLWRYADFTFPAALLDTRTLAVVDCCQHITVRTEGVL